MSRKANCWDNAVAESFFATLEKELLDDEVFFTRTHARQCVADYIENYYNNRRRHSHLDYVSPLEYEIYAAA
jgi:putative transposase|tara:strand:- start:230 stop:445 length:216 start_codon:yes stop_codon:yes gene_type:complete